MNDSQSHTPPTGVVSQDLALAKKIHEGLQRGDRRVLEPILEWYGDFCSEASKHRYEHCDPAPGEEKLLDSRHELVNAFWEKVLMPGKIFASYGGVNNCRLKSFLISALIKFVCSENRIIGRYRNKVRLVQDFSSNNETQTQHLIFSSNEVGTSAKQPATLSTTSFTCNLEEDERQKFIADMLHRTLACMDPVEAQLVKLRMDERSFEEIALVMETDPAKKAILQNDPNQLKKSADLWKHRYKRGQGPSASLNFTIHFERLLLQSGIQFTFVDGSGQEVLHPGDAAAMRELISRAADELENSDPGAAGAARIQIMNMKDRELLLLFGTVGGRQLAPSPNTELKKLQKVLDRILQDEGLELTSNRGALCLKNTRPSISDPG